MGTKLYKKSNVHINVTLRRVHVTIVAVENNTYFIFSVCVCSLSSPVFKEHVPCFIVLCGLSWRNHFFPHYLINGTISLGGLNMKCVVLVSQQLLFEIFLILRRVQEDVIINVHMSSCHVKYPY